MVTEALYCAANMPHPVFHWLVIAGCQHYMQDGHPNRSVPELTGLLCLAQQASYATLVYGLNNRSVPRNVVIGPVVCMDAPNQAAVGVSELDPRERHPRTGRESQE